MRSALVNNNTKLVENIVVADPSADVPPEGYSLILVDNEAVSKGWTYDSGSWINPDSSSDLLPQIPTSVSPRQVRLLLLQQNLLANVEAMIAQQDQATQITWQYALEFRRDDPLLNQLAANLNLTQVDIDRFFIEAAQL